MDYENHRHIGLYTPLGQQPTAQLRLNGDLK